MSSRLAAVPGEWIDRSKTRGFKFEGLRCSGFEGDTVTSALLAGGQRVLGRSFKYHRPRGVLSMANHDVNAMFQAGQRLNLRGDVEPLISGLELNAVNTFGGLKSDWARVLDKLSAFFPVGFYYKAFYRPRQLAGFWERVFRRLTGLGHLDFATPHIRTPKRYDFCDVLVIGAGPAGLSAALAAAQSGAAVVIVDENARIGGSLGYQRGASADSLALLDDLKTQLSKLPNVSLRPATLAAGYYTDHWVPLVDAKRMTKMRARALIMAGGVYEQPAVFRNNDLPGVMFASAAQRLIYRYAVRPMRRALVLTANADGYAAALDLAANGVEIAAVVDLNIQKNASPAAAEAARRGIAVMQGYAVNEARGGYEGVDFALVCPVLQDGRADASRAQRIDCDGIVVSVGYAPAAALLYQAGAQMRYDEALAQFVPEKLPEGVFAAGRVNGVFALEQRRLDGERAGREAARYLGLSAQEAPPVARAGSGVNHPYPVFPHAHAKNFVDFDEDLQLKDFENAAQEGFDNIELLKRYSTVGMGPSQGKHSNMNAIRILARILGRGPGEVGSTTARPFYHPVPMSHLAGRGFQPERLTPMHAWHREAGAVFMQAGIWLRPEFYAVSGRSKLEAVREEAVAVRNAVGLIDVGTLGKVEVHGPDAAEFLERVYTGRYANLKVGMTRYALMLDEAGVIIDDGVIARLSDQCFYFTTTTTGSASVYRELTRLNTMWRLQVGIVNVTGHYGAFNLAGPRSREVLAGLTDVDLSAQAFPYLGVREGEVAGVPARLLRVGFVGELGYEIHVPADSAAQVWSAIIEAGAGRGIRPFGVEAQRLLRLEKGHIIIGQDTDGLSTPLESAMDWALKMDKPFFIGQRSLRIVQGRPLRQKLVGFRFSAGDDGDAPKECHLIIRNGEIAGRVTSVAWSPALDVHVGLAVIAPDLAENGTRFVIRADRGRMLEAEVCAFPFYDSEGARQKEVRA